jgi:hypothetical protein
VSKYFSVSKLENKPVAMQFKDKDNNKKKKGSDNWKNKRGYK